MGKPKQVLLEILKKHYQIESIRGSDIVALNSKAILYIRYNKNAGATKNLIGKFWFGITKSEYEKYSNKQDFFIVCICLFGPNETDYLLFPSNKFDEIKEDISLQAGQWKFNLLKNNEKKYFLQTQKMKCDVTEFLNYFDFSPREFRETYSPQLRKFQPKVSEEKITPITKEPISFELEDELLRTARDSDNPKNFELALEKFFNEIGFRCKRIGGSGETDILILAKI